MEIILALVAIVLAGYWFWYRHQSDKISADSESAAPYKVETPPAVAEPARCGCGRSQSGFCVGLHKLTPEQWAVHADNPLKPAVQPVADKKAPAKKAAAKKTKATTDVKSEKPTPAKKVPAKKAAAKKTKA